MEWHSPRELIIIELLTVKAWQISSFTIVSLSDKDRTFLGDTQDSEGAVEKN